MPFPHIVRPGLQMNTCYWEGAAICNYQNHYCWSIESRNATWNNCQLIFIKRDGDKLLVITGTLNVLENCYWFEGITPSLETPGTLPRAQLVLAEPSDSVYSHRMALPTDLILYWPPGIVQNFETVSVDHQFLRNMVLQFEIVTPMWR